MKSLIFAAALVICPSVLPAAEQNQLDGNPALFSVMAAYTAAGQEATSSTSDHPLRAAVLQHISGRKLPVIDDLRRYFAEHRKADTGVDLAQYISFALSSGEPPAFEPTLEGPETPPDVQSLSGFQSLMIRFHREAGLDDLWKKVQGHYDKEIERYHEPVSKAVLDVNAYLRNPTSGYMGRRFQIYIDLLAPANQVHTRSYKDDYYIVVTPSAEPRVKDVRHAYLHYLLDPLATKYAAKINKHWPLIDIALGAPALDQSYKSDFLLLATESVIKAIESRLEKSSAVATEALLQGYILTPFFAENLPLYEKQETAMRMYFPEILDRLSLDAESRRLQKVQFASVAPAREVPARAASAPPPLSPAEAELEEAEKMYSARDLENARKKFNEILRATDNRTVHARSYYGLARIAIFDKDLDLAEQLFQKTLQSSPDPHTRSWTQVYLGRLHENTQTPTNALEHYRGALAIEGAPPGARKAAEEGLRKLSQKN